MKGNPITDARHRAGLFTPLELRESNRVGRSTLGVIDYAMRAMGIVYIGRKSPEWRLFACYLKNQGITATECDPADSSHGFLLTTEKSK